MSDTYEATAMFLQQLVPILEARLAETEALLREIREDARHFGMPTARIDAFLAPDSAPAVEQRLWLWRNGDHFLAFEHLYPCFTPGGDPMTLGEPVGYAIVKRSFDRAPDSAMGESHE